MRALSQSIAREFAPKGVHVAHAIIDGVIDIPRTKDWLKDMPPEAKISAEGVSLPHSLPHNGHVVISTDCGLLLASAHAAQDDIYKRDRHQANVGKVVKNYHCDEKSIVCNAKGVSKTSKKKSRNLVSHARPSLRISCFVSLFSCRSRSAASNEVCDDRIVLQ